MATKRPIPMPLIIATVTLFALGLGLHVGGLVSGNAWLFFGGMGVVVLAGLCPVVALLIAIFRMWVAVGQEAAQQQRDS